MKKVLLATLFVIGAACGVDAQKYAIIDTKYILGKMPTDLTPFSKEMQDMFQDRVRVATFKIEELNLDEIQSIDYKFIDNTPK